ncbi:hypothetical protein CC86DRAFT_372079 [Ophiobolus disseminans]|uniref:Uncharacterized protein n=1 Tax=Ophiobolus disseminans TaxID=1469910 RepID=A0A6A6ZS61_9PLEO|nr:hypothetical protein CC86DRAFT_372079 [Ophiobolus disseminans]
MITTTNFLGFQSGTPPRTPLYFLAGLQLGSLLITLIIRITASRVGQDEVFGLRKGETSQAEHAA